MLHIKKIVLFYTIAIIITIIFILLFFVNNFISNQEEYSIVDNRFFIEIFNDDIEEIISTTGNVIIYIGRNTCPECQIVEPYIKQLAVDNRITIFYYNTAVAREEDEEKFLEILDYLDVSIVPTILYFLNGDLIDNINNLTSDDILYDFKLILNKTIIQDY